MTMHQPECHPELVKSDTTESQESDFDDERPRKVKFTDVEVILCSLRISGNPSCSDYVALELDEEVGRDEKMSVEEFEISRPECRRRRDTDLRLTRFEREEILQFYDFSRQDVEDFVMDLRAELRAYEEAERTRANGLLSLARNTKKATESWTKVFSKSIMNSVLDVVDVHRHIVAEGVENPTPDPPRRSGSGDGGAGSVSSQSGSFFSGTNSTGTLLAAGKLSQTRALVLKAATEELTTTVSKSKALTDEASTPVAKSKEETEQVTKTVSVSKLAMGEVTTTVSKTTTAEDGKAEELTTKVSELSPPTEVPTTGSTPVVSNVTSQDAPKRKKSIGFKLSKSALWGKKKEKKKDESPSAKKLNNSKKAADLYLLSGTGFGPLGTM